MAKTTDDPGNFGPPTKATPPFPQAGSAMPRQVPRSAPPPPKKGAPPRDRHKTPARRTKHS